MSHLMDPYDAQEYEALLQFLYMAPVGLVQLASDGNILMLNPLSAQLLMPLSRDGALTNLFDALTPVAPDLRHLCSQFSDRQGQVCDALRLYLSAGGQGPQVLSLSILKLDETRLMAVLSDITQQERRERLLRKTDAWLHAIMTNIADYALVSLDAQGRIDGWNDSITRVTGFDAAIQGQSYALFYPPGSASAAQCSERLQEAERNGWALDEGLRQRADGSQFWGSCLISPMPERSRRGSDEPAYCLIIRDISDKRDISDNLRRATYSDHLTGVANRRAFFEAGERELARRQQGSRTLAMLMLDADHFKGINDRHGHPAGDAVLQHLARTMQAQCRDVDVLARLGGEEFAILLPAVDQQDALGVAERLRAEVAAYPATYEGQPIAYTVSIGVALLQPEHSTLDGLIKAADQALYHAKQSGRNRVCLAATSPETAT